jgi:hypothetical protein
MEERKALEEIIKEEFDKKWIETQVRATINFFKSPESQHENSSFTAYEAPSHYWQKIGYPTPYDYFLNEIIESSIKLVNSKSDAKTLLEAIFDKVYLRVSNLADAGTHNEESYYPRYYLEIREAVEFSKDKNKMKEILSSNNAILSGAKNCLESLKDMYKSQWEGIGAENFGDFCSLNDIIKKIENKKPNVRMIACKVLEECSSLYTAEQKKAVIAALESKQEDLSYNEINSSFQCEEDEALTVRDYAIKSLEKIK